MDKLWEEACEWRAPVRSVVMLALWDLLWVESWVYGRADKRAAWRASSWAVQTVPVWAAWRAARRASSWAALTAAQRASSWAVQTVPVWAAWRAARRAAGRADSWDL
jgi:hypothetical protein